MDGSKAVPSRPLVVAVPKGRVLKQLVPRLERAGVDAKVLLADDRTLVREDPVTGTRFLLLKPDDVPTYVEYGAADLGIVGRDVLLERDYDLFQPVDLGIGICRMMVCGRAGERVPDDLGRALRVGTKFTNIAAKYFRERGLAVELIYLGGSVELAPLTGLADVIVDIVETGETLRQNGLEPFEPICDVSTVVISNRVGAKVHRKAIEPFLKVLRASE